jgi:hypothetical protein
LSFAFVICPFIPRSQPRHTYLDFFLPLLPLRLLPLASDGEVAVEAEVEEVEGDEAASVSVVAVFVGDMAAAAAAVAVGSATVLSAAAAVAIPTAATACVTSWTTASVMVP